MRSLGHTGDKSRKAQELSESLYETAQPLQKMSYRKSKFDNQFLKDAKQIQGKQITELSKKSDIF